MTDRNTPQVALPSPPVITLASRISAGAAVRMTGSTNPATGNNPFAINDMLAFPFVLSAATTIYKAFWQNGSVAGSSYALAVYNAEFVLLGQSTPTTGVTNNSTQVVTLAMKLPPGLFYCAMASDSGTVNRLFRWSVTTLGAGMWKSFGCWRQASVTVATLPNPAAPVACNNVGFPVYGLITRSGFDV
jgi:hypothetical protein